LRSNYNIAQNHYINLLREDPSLSYNFDYEREFFIGLKKLWKAFNLRGQTKYIVELLLRAREHDLEGFSYKEIEQKLGIKELHVYLARLQRKGLLEKQGKLWSISSSAYLFFVEAKNYKWRTKEDLEDLKKRIFGKEEEYLGKLVKISYVYASHNRKYIVENQKTNLEEDLKKVTEDLKERFPLRGYDFKELPIKASKVFVVKEKERPYKIYFHCHENNVEVLIPLRDLKENKPFVLWILRTLLYKLKLLKKGDDKDGQQQG
jgi:hypothetical protein